MRGNVVRLFGGHYEARMRRPHEPLRDPLPRGHSAHIIQLPDLTTTTHDEVRDMARRFFRADRAVLRTAQMRRTPMAKK